MALWPDSPVPPLVTVHPWSLESLGPALPGVVALPMGSLTTSATWPVANTALFVPFWVLAPATFLQMFLLHGATASGNVDLGVYDANGTRLMSLGSTAQAGVSQIVAYNTPDITLPPGRYFMAVAASAATTTMGGTAAITTPQQKLLGVYQMASAFPLPATATFATPASIARIPVFGLTTNAVV